ncbi:MAG TPA: TetR family transcriptional regulator [Streptosporangiaceae bacterium]|jgi:AcrR family transcriptional regulator
MEQLSEEGRPAAGLRERKKARTKAAIQREAVRLFRDQGYAATTVEQIAAAAEVAPSTVYRYFPTKEDLVISDDYDEAFFRGLESMPPDLTPIQAERRVIREVLGALPEAVLGEQRERFLLMLSEPELWGASLGNISQTMRVRAEQVAARVGRDPDDPAVQAYVGAVFGVMLAVAFGWAQQPDMDFTAALDEALGYLEKGLPL